MDYSIIIMSIVAGATLAYATISFWMLKIMKRDKERNNLIDFLSGNAC